MLWCQQLEGRPVSLGTGTNKGSPLIPTEGALTPGPGPTRFSWGSVSGKKKKMNNMSETAKRKLIQGTISTDRNAPSMGPTVKAREKATPMTA